LIRELIANVGVSKGGGLLTMDLGACPGKAKRGTPSAGSMVYLEADLAAVIKIFNVLQHPSALPGVFKEPSDGSLCSYLAGPQMELDGFHAVFLDQVCDESDSSGGCFHLCSQI
jgi:hypothetical protein